MRLVLLAATALLITACGETDPAPADTEVVVTTDGAENADVVPDDSTIAGGPCSYDEAVIEAHVITIEDGQVELAETGGESFYMQAQDFPADVKAGDDFTIRAELITEGTCTPEIYTIIEGDELGVE